MSDKKNWVYDDLDFDNRVTNLMWTISGDYEENMDVGEKSFISKDVALYQGITAGGRRKYINWASVKKYIISRVRAGFDKDTVLGLVQMATDVIVEEKIMTERPGIFDIRQKAYNDILSNYYKLHTDNLLEKAKHTLVLEKVGKNPRMDSTTQGLLKDIKALSANDDTIEMLRGLEGIYLKYFPLYVYSEDGKVLEEKSKNHGEQSDFSDFMLEEYYDDEPEVLDIEDNLDEIADSLLGESLEGSSFNGDLKSDRILRIQEEDLEKIYEKVSYHYGKSYLSTTELRRLQNKVCRDVHGTCRVHMTDGVIRSNCDNGFQKNLVGRHKIKNKLFYGLNKRIHKRNINKLRDSIARTLVQEEFKDEIPSDQGQLVSSKLWRIGRSSNTKVFVRTLDNDKGSYVVDILIDSSGSQRKNQASVASQAYVLAEALTFNGIPNRVIGFSSFLDYTILKRFRDYESNIRENDNIFEYVCTGNNRDGLAIKTVVQDLKKRPEDNKILIILSDGRPNDIKVGKNQSKNLEESYRGKIAIRDTAIEVRRARQAGIMVLGVFTGKEKDLGAEKLIYGKDFTYIKDINRFADIVIKYLKQIITN
ncbi:MAG: nitric oxide reductase activation-like protein [Eubacterium sp.]